MTPPIPQSEAFEVIFRQRGLTGCFIARALPDGVVLGCNLERASRQLRPMSTFKVLNALIALELGVADPAEEIDWDGGPAWGELQKRRLNIGTALECSALWFFQILARRVGLDRYRQYLKLSNYGNAECGGTVDTFWIDGTLLISPIEQLGFIRRFAEGQLPFSAAVVSTVKEMLTVERSPGTIIRAKTGYADAPGHRYGWYVGYHETCSMRYGFVTHLDISNINQLQERRDITAACLSLLVAENW